MLFGNQDSISANSLKVDQTPRFENHIDILTSYPFLEIEIEHESDSEPQVGNSISRCTDTGFNVDSEIEKKSGKDTRDIIESKSEMKLLT